MSEIRSSTRQLNFFKQHQLEEKKKVVHEVMEVMNVIENEIEELCLNSFDENENENEFVNEFEEDLEKLRNSIINLNPDFAYTVLRDNQTRWNSVRRLLERALQTKSSVEATTKEYNYSNRLTSEDWESIRLLVFVYIFYNVFIISALY